MKTIGVDVSKDKLDCALLREEDKLKTKVIANKLTGWQLVSRNRLRVPTYDAR